MSPYWNTFLTKKLESDSISRSLRKDQGFGTSLLSGKSYTDVGSWNPPTIIICSLVPCNS